MDALFNRNGQTCRELYDEISNGKPSRTRKNIDRLSGLLNQHGIHSIQETDVICYSTPTSRELTTATHAGGDLRGKEIFRYVLEQLRPQVLIVHRAHARRELAATLGIAQIGVPQSARDVCDVQTERHLVIPTPSLSPPAFNGWSLWSGELMDRVAVRVEDRLAP